MIQGAANVGFTLAATDDFTDKFVNMEAIATVPKSAVISLTLHSTFETDTGIKTINLSGDTNTSGANVVDVSNTDGQFTVTGSAGVDSFTERGVKTLPEEPVTIPLLVEPEMTF